MRLGVKVGGGVDREVQGAVMVNIIRDSAILRHGARGTLGPLVIHNPPLLLPVLGVSSDVLRMTRLDW